MDPGAAAHALASLNVVKRQQAKLSNSPLPTTDINRGVAKLGFSWEALDVKYWEGESGLESALHQLTQAIEISGKLCELSDGFCRAAFLSVW